ECYCLLHDSGAQLLF
nr:immunoglobulin light chain junction region [Macaca mulatta]